MAVQRVTKASEDMADTVAESDSNATDNKPQPLSKCVVKPLSDTESETEHTVADLGVVSRSNLEAFVENTLTKCTNTLQ